MAHTPGPWESPFFDIQIKGQPFDHNYEIYPPLGESGPIAIVSSKDDAVLIAAATDMLAACEAQERTDALLVTYDEARQRYAHTYNGFFAEYKAWRDARDESVRLRRAAIAKARGE